MKFKAILFMCNDFVRADWVISNFKLHHSDVPLVVYNGGNKEHSLFDRTDVTFIHGSNLFVAHPRSFSPDMAKLLFEFGLDQEYTHTLLLETDVKINRPITIEPVYDMAGAMNRVGHSVNNILTKFWEIETPDLHCGAGGTIFRYEYFDRGKENLSKLDRALIELPNLFFMDVHLTYMGVASGCEVGDWQEVSNIGGCYTKEGRHMPINLGATLVHGIKI